MSDVSSQASGLELSMVADSDVRRAMRSMHQQMTDALAKQQLELDALLGILLEKNIASLSEFKRQIQRLQQNQVRTQRIHTAVESAQAVAAR